MKHIWIYGFLFFILINTACNKDETVDVSLRFNLFYDGSPLVMFQEYAYPDGKAFQFTRVSFFISDLRLDTDQGEVVIKEVDFINLTQSHSDPASAQEGFLYYTGSVPASSINRLSFNVGLTPEQNQTVPADYASGHPLARPGEYWLAWDSYIFAKIEGWVDLDGDGQVESGVALHLGSDAVQQKMAFDLESGTENIQLDLELKTTFEQDSIYDIETTPQIHTLSQLPYALELAQNLGKSFNVKSL
jgi:hypothetical protein